MYYDVDIIPFYSFYASSLLLFDKAKDKTPIKHPTINKTSSLVTLSPSTKNCSTLVIKGAVLIIMVTINNGISLML